MPRQPRFCSADDCDRKHLAKGFCQMHYGRVYRNGNPDEKRVRTSDRVCEAVLDGQQCGKPHSGKGFCANHYAQWKRWGDPFGKRPPGLKPAKYKYIQIPGYPGSGKKGRIAEHRWVMSEMLGRGLLPHENVHHKNGDPRDNRPENLELWSTAQPYGQRVEDKVEWAVELLKLYAPDKLKEINDRYRYENYYRLRFG